MFNKILYLLKQVPCFVQGQSVLSGIPRCLYGLMVKIYISKYNKNKWNCTALVAMQKRIWKNPLENLHIAVLRRVIYRMCLFNDPPHDLFPNKRIMRHLCNQTQDLLINNQLIFYSLFIGIFFKHYRLSGNQMMLILLHSTTQRKRKYNP